MKNLANQNKNLLPDIAKIATQNNFIGMDLEEFILGAADKLPSGNEGQFMVWINHQTNIDGQGEVKDNKTFLFYILKQYEAENFAKQELARIETEQTAHQLLGKMKKDSQENVFWNHKFDNVRANVNPITRTDMATHYAGWMVDFRIVGNYKNCFDAADWHP